MDEHNSQADMEPEVQEIPNLNVLQRMMGVFLSPRKTFQQLDRRPDWILPMTVIVIATFVFASLTLPISLPEQMEKQRAKMVEQGMSGEQIDKAMAVGEKVGKIMGVAAAVIGPPISFSLISLFYWFIGNIVLKGQTSYLKVFSVYTYTSLINILGALVLLPLILFKKTADISLSLALYLPDDLKGTLVGHVSRMLDVFALWHLCVFAIGFAVIYKFTLKKAGMTMGILFLLYATTMVAVMEMTA